MRQADCRIKCWNDCDCQAYLKSDTVGCSVIFGHDKWFQPDPSGSAPQNYVIKRPSPSPPQPQPPPNGKCVVSYIILPYYYYYYVYKSWLTFF